MKCPNCGSPVDASAPFCSHCGAAMTTPVKQPPIQRILGQIPGRKLALEIFVGLLFFMIGIPSGFIGGCLLVTSVSVANNGSGTILDQQTNLGLGCLGLLIFAGLLWALIASSRKKP